MEDVFGPWSVEVSKMINITGLSLVAIEMDTETGRTLVNVMF